MERQRKGNYRHVLITFDSKRAKKTSDSDGGVVRIRVSLATKIKIWTLGKLQHDHGVLLYPIRWFFLYLKKEWANCAPKKKVPCHPSTNLPSIGVCGTRMKSSGFLLLSVLLASCGLPVSADVSCPASPTATSCYSGAAQTVIGPGGPLSDVVDKLRS